MRRIEVSRLLHEQIRDAQKWFPKLTIPSGNTIIERGDVKIRKPHQLWEKIRRESVLLASTLQRPVHQDNPHKETDSNTEIPHPFPTSWTYQDLEVLITFAASRHTLKNIITDEGQETEIPAHLLVWIHDLGRDISSFEDSLDALRFSHLSKEELASVCEMLSHAFQMCWSLLLNSGPIDMFFTTGYRSPIQVKQTGTARGAQSSPNYHAVFKAKNNPGELSHEEVPQLRFLKQNDPWQLVVKSVVPLIEAKLQSIVSANTQVACQEGIIRFTFTSEDTAAQLHDVFTVYACLDDFYTWLQDLFKHAHTQINIPIEIEDKTSEFSLSADDLTTLIDLCRQVRPHLNQVTEWLQEFPDNEDLQQLHIRYERINNWLQSKYQRETNHLEDRPEDLFAYLNQLPASAYHSYLLLLAELTDPLEGNYLPHTTLPGRFSSVCSFTPADETSRDLKFANAEIKFATHQSGYVEHYEGIWIEREEGY